MRRKVIVISDGPGWAVKREGHWSPVSTHWNHLEAIQVGRALAARHSVEVVIHDADGNVLRGDGGASDATSVRGAP